MIVRPLRLALALAALAACSSNGGTVTPTADSGPPPSDVPATTDTAPAADVPLPTDVPAMDVPAPTDAPGDQSAQCAALSAYSLRCRPDAACAAEATRALCLRYRPDLVAIMSTCAATLPCTVSGSGACPALQTALMTGTPAFNATLRSLCNRCPGIGATSGTTNPTVDQCITAASSAMGFGSSIIEFNDATLTAITACANGVTGDGGLACLTGVYNCLTTAIPELAALRMCSGA